MNSSGLRAVDAFKQICRTEPSLACRDQASRGRGLYGWNTGPVQEVHIPETGELILSLHLGGARRVQVFTRDGLSRSFSKPGDITLMPYGQPIGFHTKGEVHFATLHFQPPSTHRRSSEALARILRLSSCLFAFRDEYVSASIKALMRAARQPITSRENGLYVAKLFDSLTAHLARLVEDSDAERIDLPSRAALDEMSAHPLRAIRAPDFDAVLRYIEQALSGKITLESLADQAGVSRALFAREFSARFHCTPHRYLNHRRIQRAKQLLLDRHLGCADVAYAVGFSGQSHFTQIFREFEGCTPQAFVRAARSGSETKCLL